MLTGRKALYILVVIATIGLSGCNRTLTTRPTPAGSLPADKPGQPTKTVPQSREKPGPRALASQEPGVVPKEQSLPGDEATETIDIWERIRQGYQLSTANVKNPRVQQELKWYATHPAYLQRVEERASPYLFFIVEEIEKRGMPMELALLPVVESAFRPFAYSPGRAAGIWQFIPSTGRMYGLKQNWWYDGRRDVMAATHAALDFLQSLAKQFDGDWELALAAYNSGAGTVRSAIRRNKKKGRPGDYWSLDLPRETEGYVPRLLALSRLVADPERYGNTLSVIPNEPYFDAVNIETQLDLAMAAEMAGIPIEEIYRLNPGFNRWATDPDGPHRLALPLKSIDDFNSRLSQLDPEQRLKWKRYKIKSGDNLGSIAQRHGTTVSVLKRSNRLRNSRIRAGKHLLIPESTHTLSHYTLSSEQRRNRLQNSKRKGSKLTHTVRSGDTLWDIALANRVSHKALARWNGISPRDNLQPGQQLVVWSRTGEIASSPAPDTTARIDTQSSLHYRVRKGDSLSRIAQRFNVSVADLRKWNGLQGKYLQPGQRLKLYLDVAEQTI